MNPRERTLLGVLLAILIVGGGGAGFYFFFFKDYADQRGKNAEEQKKLNDKEDELKRANELRADILARDPRLERWKEISLPDLPVKPGVKRNEKDVENHIRKMQVDYQHYLDGLLRDSKFVPASITISAMNVDTKPVDSKGGVLAKDKVPVYTRLPFNVQGVASYDAIIDMLRAFHSDPLLQEVRKISITKPTTPRTFPSESGPGRPGGPGGPAGPGGRPMQGDPVAVADPAAPVDPNQVVPGRPGPGGPGGPGGFQRPGGRGANGNGDNLLDVQMTVEVLIVTGADPRSTTTSVLPKISRGEIAVLAKDPPRPYPDMLEKDPFHGKKIVDKVVVDDNTPTEKSEAVMPFVKLTMIYQEGTRAYKATLYNQSTNEDQPASLNRDNFSIKDIFGKVKFEGKVLFLDASDLVFMDKQGSKYYRLRVGESMQRALDNPLTTKDLEKYNLKPKEAAAAAPGTP